MFAFNPFDGWDSFTSDQQAEMLAYYRVRCAEEAEYGQQPF